MSRVSCTDVSVNDVQRIPDSPQNMWLLLPQSLRDQLGFSTCVPPAEMLFHLCLDDEDRRILLWNFSQDAEELTFFCKILEQLQSCLQHKARLCQKRRATVDPAEQYLFAIKQARTIRASQACSQDSLQRLVLHSGAR